MGEIHVDDYSHRYIDAVIGRVLRSDDGDIRLVITGLNEMDYKRKLQILEYARYYLHSGKVDSIILDGRNVL